MTHADSLAIPSDVASKEQFYAHVIETMKGQSPSYPGQARSGQARRVSKACSCFPSPRGPTPADRTILPPISRPTSWSHGNLLLSNTALLGASGPKDPVQQNWLSQLSNAASLLFGSMENYEAGWGRQPGRRCNWSGAQDEPFFRAHAKCPS